MVDQRKGKGEYIQWRPEESEMLIELAANCIKQGWFDPKGRMFKKTVETKILSVLNEKFNGHKTYKHYINRIKILKNQYRDFVNLLHFDSKFEWNPITNKFTAPDQVWNAYFSDNPNHTHLRYQTHEEYENMKLLFGKNVGRRRFERSLSQAFEVRKNEKPKQEVVLTTTTTTIDDDEVIHESMENFIDKALPDQGDRNDDASGESVKEKDVFKKVTTELTSIDSFSKQMLQIMQERSMVEGKNSKVWDAITEIPNLANDVRYKALTMIQKLEMRDVFVNMSTEDRLGWIQYNTK